MAAADIGHTKPCDKRNFYHLSNWIRTMVHRTWLMWFRFPKLLCWNHHHQSLKRRWLMKTQTASQTQIPISITFYASLLFLNWFYTQKLFSANKSENNDFCDKNLKKKIELQLMVSFYVQNWIVNGTTCSLETWLWNIFLLLLLCRFCEAGMKS